MARAVTTMQATELRSQHDAMAERLASRSSILHFAHAAVSGFICLILLGASGKLWWDFSETNPEWALAMGGLGLAAMAYSLTRYFLGSRQLKRELADLEKLKALRRELGVDDPAALLPS